MAAKSDPHRQSRVASRIQETLSAQLSRVGDPRVKKAVIVGVEVNRDCSLAHVTIACMGDDSEQKTAKAACKVLRTMEGGFRKRIGPLLGLRVVPELIFVVDVERQERERMEALIDEVGRELRDKPTES